MKKRKITLKVFTYIVYMLISLALLIYILISSKNNDISFISAIIAIWALFIMFCLYKIFRAKTNFKFFDKNAAALNDIDRMSGIEFEKFACNILLQNGFDTAENTKASGDFGVDILAEKDGITYAIQCKCHNDKIGINAVQQAYAGKSFYDCHLAVVLTNQYFTVNAQKLADKIGVILWDRDMLKSFF